MVLLIITLHKCQCGFKLLTMSSVACHTLVYTCYGEHVVKYYKIFIEFYKFKNNRYLVIPATPLK